MQAAAFETVSLLTVPANVIVAPLYEATVLVAAFAALLGWIEPVASLIVGQTAPPGRRMGHAGAVITGTAALASEKMRALEDAGCHVIPTPADIGSTVKAMLG